MNSQKELLELIEKQIDAINKHISSISIKNYEETKKNKTIIEDNSSLTNFNFLTNFDLNELKQILPNTYEADLANLSFYINILNTSYANELNKGHKEVLEQIKNILSKIHTYLTDLSKKQEEEKKEIATFETTKTKLSQLKNKIKSSEEHFESEEIETVYKILSTLEDKNKAIDLLISFGEEILKPKEVSIESEEEKEYFYENKDKQAIEEQIRIIFNKFNLNYDIFYNNLSTLQQKEFINYVKPNNVEDILNVLKEFDISLNDSYCNNILLQHKAKQLKELFMYSNGDTIRKVLNCANKEKIYNNEILDVNGNIKTGIDFNLLLDSPAKFIERKRRYKLRGNELLDIKFGQDSFGAANDFINNVELFKSLGVNPIDLCKNATVSVIATDKIKQIISIFNMYGLDKGYYTKTLSCFDSIHQADILDQFIELGQFNYILKNMSRCKLMPDSPIFYRLVYGIKHTNLPMESMINKNGVFTHLINEGSKKEGIPSFDINAYNKQRKVNQTATFYGDDQVYKAYNELVNPLSSNIMLAISRDDSIVKILDEHFLVKTENGQMIYPNIYNFGTIDTPRGPWQINISRNKVLRICNELMQHNANMNSMDTIMYIVTKNSILTQEEYNIIYKQIDNVREKGVEK